MDVLEQQKDPLKAESEGVVVLTADRQGLGDVNGVDVFVPQIGLHELVEVGWKGNLPRRHVDPSTLR